uniref:Uncharacterized protein n=1 Tax=Anguilla anguilla TaxID=7936 RepID=A0A0E9WT50_ANGAN
MKILELNFDVIPHSSIQASVKRAGAQGCPSLAHLCSLCRLYPCIAVDCLDLVTLNSINILLFCHY